MSINVHPSGLATFAKCGLQYEFFWLKRLKIPPGIAQEYGTSMHTTLIDTDQAHRIKTGGYLPIESLKETFAQEFDRRILETDPFDRDAVELGGHAKARDVLQRWGFASIEEYNKNRSVLNGRAVEVPFKIPYGEGTLEGRIDIDVSPSEFKDLKTRDLSRPRAKRIQPSAVAYSIQYAAYAAAKAQMEKEPEIKVSQVTLYKREKPIPLEEISVTRGPANHEAAEEYAATVQRAIAAGIFLPVDKSSTNAWVCQSRYCGAWSSTLPDGSKGCPFGERASVSIAVKGESEE